MLEHSRKIELEQMAHRMRVATIELAHRAGKKGAHLGGALSAIEIMAALYGYAMNISYDNRMAPDRDRFLLSKGHGSLAYYTALFESGLISRETLECFEQNGGPLPGQPVRNLGLGIDTSSGSLGMGLSIGVGLAVAAKRQNRSNYVYVLLGDGECNEGAVWEAAMSAVHFSTERLIAIVDCNHMQSDGRCEDVFRTAPLERMWQGFGWETQIVNGHDISALCAALDRCREAQRPSVILAQTVKGKGVSFAENAKGWHHGILTDELYEQAMSEVCHGNI
ncbi:transketolase [Candidatus Avoscillospira sp. LCP25S3_F1]|uniref:transketolase n=1 Tax=Candidatus Avoscillospira sp. LCP25S3_F1 TaxID=3438825 RepID=UPI003F91796F